MMRIIYPSHFINPNNFTSFETEDGVLSREIIDTHRVNEPPHIELKIDVPLRTELWQLLQRIAVSGTLVDIEDSSGFTFYGCVVMRSENLFAPRITYGVLETRITDHIHRFSFQCLRFSNKPGGFFDKKELVELKNIGVIEIDGRV